MSLLPQQAAIVTSITPDTGLIWGASTLRFPLKAEVGFDHVLEVDARDPKSCFFVLCICRRLTNE